MSVLEKSRQLMVRARTYSDGAKERDERTRIGNALAEVARALSDLSSAADAYAAARKVGVPVTVLTPPPDLINTSSEGLPSSQALTAARKRATALARDARTAVSLSWGDWAQAKLDTVNPGRISRLGIQHRQRAKELQKCLRTAVAVKQAEAAQVSAFCRDLDALEQMLAGIHEEDPVVLLLNRSRQGRTTLADLTDAEIDSLRADSSVASQVFLQTS